jgi:hypothetical protein
MRSTLRGLKQADRQTVWWIERTLESVPDAEGADNPRRPLTPPLDHDTSHDHPRSERRSPHALLHRCDAKSSQQMPCIRKMVVMRVRAFNGHTQEGTDMPVQ